MRDVQTRLLASVKVENGCWIWQKHRDKRGYGRIFVHGKVRFTHRIAYEQFVGPLTDDLTIHHLCFVTGCCNPEHLTPVTLERNLQLQPAALKDFCINGHELSGDNLYIRKANAEGRRQCRACNLAAVKRYQQRIGR